MKTLARALAGLIAAVGAALMAVTLLVVNPLTRPILVGQAVVETGAHADAVRMGSDLLWRQALFGNGTGGTETRRPSLTQAEEDRFRSVVAGAFSADWMRATISTVAEGMESWVSGHGRPPVTIDLREPKEWIREHPDSEFLVSLLAGPDDDQEIGQAGADPTRSDSKVDEFLAEIPDRAALHDAAWWNDFVTRASDVRRGSAQIGLTAGAVAILAAAGGLALTRRPIVPAASGWFGWLSLWVALPALGLSWAAPATAAAIPLPGQVSLLVRLVEGTWGSTRALGWVALTVAFALWALAHVLRARAAEKSAEPESVGELERVLATAS